MKTIGLLGGMSWESTALYYRLINQQVRLEKGGLHSAPILLHSVEFSEIQTMQAQGRWEDAGKLLGQAAAGLESAGADFIVICTNTMHKVANIVAQYITIPILHLADATASRLRHQGISKVGLLGTAYTMEQDFYISRIAAADIEVVVPNAKDRKIVNSIIFKELCQGEIHKLSRNQYLRIIDTMREQGVEAVIKGCTEITLLVQQQHTDMPLFDTTRIHAEEAVAFAL